MPLTTDQKTLITSSLPALQEHGATVTTSFYTTLLSENPSLRSTFNLTHQRTASQPFALASVLAAYARHITDPSVLGPAVEAINHRHVSLGVTAEQYSVVGTYLLRAMSEVLGQAFTEDLKGAWGAAYGDLASGMVKAEEELYTIAEREKWEGSGAAEGHFRKCKVVEKVVEADDVVSLRFWPVGWEAAQLPSYKAGQYISVRVQVKREGLEQIRQYTLSDAPESATNIGYRITPKKIGMVSEVLHGLDVGDEVDISFPRGVFFYQDEDRVVLDRRDQDAAPLVLISAGIGLTPMLSIMTSALSSSETRKMSWIHSSRSWTRRPFEGGLHALAMQHSGLTMKTFVTGSRQDEKISGGDFEGRFDLNKLDRSIDLHLDDDRTLYYLCGPQGFMESVGKMLKHEGVPGERIKAEMFGVGSPSF
ncbi:hypothetical protein CAC42_4156 [Sphaceloma murrayae]|uniref:nitric oxide dioxygenase n=1 Tax=Sphaceloma murrayae TaxID=2082308 RepID=A0A2K1QKL9_9PEZI|nr:hypothetical protein CAC42_4156 [Sphaceloma murrayae]